jgi:hypothetical protein
MQAGRKWDRSGEQNRHDGRLCLTFVLESGDKNASDAQRIFNWIKAQNPTFDRMIYSFGFADKRTVR